MPLRACVPNEGPCGSLAKPVVERRRGSCGTAVDTVVPLLAVTSGSRQASREAVLAFITQSAVRLCLQASRIPVRAIGAQELPTIPGPLRAEAPLGACCGSDGRIATVAASWAWVARSSTRGSRKRASWAWQWGVVASGAVVPRDA